MEAAEKRETADILLDPHAAGAAPSDDENRGRAV